MKQIKITYTGSLNPELDQTILDEMKKQGHKWYAQGYDFETKVRDIVFDKMEDQPKKQGGCDRLH